MTNSSDLIDHADYNPNHLLDKLVEKLRLKNDAALSQTLDVTPPAISRIRHLRLPVRASLQIRMHEVSGLSILELRTLMGERRNKYRVSYKQYESNYKTPA